LLTAILSRPVVPVCSFSEETMTLLLQQAMLTLIQLNSAAITTTEQITMHSRQPTTALLAAA
jgi:hypothetical protein